MDETFLQLAAILLIAFVVSYIIRLMKQPIVIGYILAGILVSPFLIMFGATTGVIDIFSKIGITFLLFIVGLNLNPKIIKSMGIKVLIISLSQMLLTFGITFLISNILLGYKAISSAYIGIALAFSSTIILMKLLSDKGQLDSLFGKISIGILVIQDFVAIIILIFISTLSGGLSFGALAIKTFLIGGGLIVGLFLFGYLILPRITKSVAKSQELLFLFSICWCFLIVALFDFFGFSIEIGALLAGMVLAISPYSTEISAKIKPLRDFFIIIFFIILGLNINLLSLKSIFVNALILSGIALILKPIILMSLMAFFKYTKRVSFLVGTSLAQISSFSLIILMLGVSLGQISTKLLYTVTLALVITIFVSTYMVIYSRKLYGKVSRFLTIFESKKIKKERKNKKMYYDSILFGYNRTGFDILKSLNKLKKRYLVVDFNPDTIENLIKFRVPSLYGDADDPEFLNELNLDKINLAISTIPDYEINMQLIELIRTVNKDAIIISRASTIQDAKNLYRKGADYVLTPDFLGGEHISKMIRTLRTNKKGYAKEKEKHLKILEEVLNKSKGRLRDNLHRDSY